MLPTPSASETQFRFTTVAAGVKTGRFYATNGVDTVFTPQFNMTLSENPCVPHKILNPSNYNLQYYSPPVVYDYDGAIATYVQEPYVWDFLALGVVTTTDAVNCPVKHWEILQVSDWSTG